MFLERSYQQHLKKVFAERSQRNRSYSLRSFARDLKIAPSRLSDVLNGKMGLSATNAKKIAERLGLTSEEAERFLLSVAAQHSRSSVQREDARARLISKENTTNRQDHQELSIDLYQIVADWWHYAILEITALDDFKSDLDWIARRLALPRIEIELAVARLKKLGLIEEHQRRLKAATDTTASPSGIPSEAIRKHHRQALAKAAEALDTASIEERDFSTLTLAMSSTQVKEAQALIKKFRRDLATLLSNAPKKDRVYNLSIQLYPLDHPSETKNKKTPQKRNESL